MEKRGRKKRERETRFFFSLKWRKKEKRTFHARAAMTLMSAEAPSGRSPDLSAAFFVVAAAVVVNGEAPLLPLLRWERL